jgi:predicted permease
MIIREGICRVVKLYLIAFTGYGIKRKGYKYPDAILALKKLNYIFAKYTLYRLLDL